MTVMNQQSTRAGKLQVELDPQQVRRLVGWLRIAAAVAGPVGTPDQARQMADYLAGRAARRWGSNG
jgi:hypothetical protein